MRTKTLLTKASFAKLGEAFAAVELPHTWNNLDGQDGGSDYWRGIGTYLIDLPDPTEGKKQYIEIQGANHVATVYCNGKKLGSHEGGFSTFRFDLTGAMKKCGNVLAVEVTNAVSDIYPQSADFTFYGGLYRDVNFIEADAAHFDLLKDGTDGVFVTPHCTGKTRVDLFPVGASEMDVKVSIKDGEGKEVASGSAKAEAHTVIKLDVANPHLWNGMADPYCYSLEATIEKDGAVIDSVEVSYGYRGFYVDPANGFFLNGKSVPLRGVSRHQDRLDKGWAISKEDHEEDIEIIKEVGANTIRLAHYQHDQYFYSLCDKTGFAVWAEIPFISVFNPSKKAHDNTISQMRELVAQNYNHPSILFWGISNEITIAGESEALYQNLTELHSLVKSMDPIRLTTMAEVTITPKNSEHVYITDILSYNHYFGWYVGDVEDNGPWLDEFHRINPDRALGVSEYGAEAVLNWHTAYPENHDYTEEYAAYYHHEMLKTFEARPYLWSTHVWNMFDFAADARDEGGVRGRNNKGLVTYDRKIRKQAFYLYKAYWNSEPMVYVAGERFVDRAPDERDIAVYTNCPSVTLVVNGKEVGTLDAVDRAAVFKSVALEKGENTVTAYSGDVKGNEIKLNGVDVHNYAYDLPAGNEAANWFEDPAAIAARKKLTYKEGFYSIKDKISDLLANPKTAAILMPLFSAMGGQNEMAGDMSDPNNPMREFMMLMRLDSMLKMAGKMVPAGFKEDLNNKLQAIEK